MLDSLNSNDIMLIRKALSYYAQVHYDRGVFVDKKGRADIKEECYEVVRRCDAVRDKLKNSNEDATQLETLANFKDANGNTLKLSYKQSGEKYFLCVKENAIEVDRELLSRLTYEYLRHSNYFEV